MADGPLMQQYRQMKEQYPGMVLFFRLGDFYEMFDDDAVEVSSLLNLTLTHRADSPMCGIPYHAAKNYLKRLLDAGKKVAICEQTELSTSSKALAKREVVRIVTPATVVDEGLLDDRDFSYIICVFQNSCAFCDVSTGDFHLRCIQKDTRIQGIRAVLEQVSPKEILVCEDEYFLDGPFKSAIDDFHAMVTKLPSWYFSTKGCFKLLCEHAGVKSLAAYGLAQNDKLLSPAGALLRYVQETSKSSVAHLTNYRVDSEDAYVFMDESSRRNLELFQNLFDGSARYSLFDTINRTRTSGGGRLLKSWLSLPLRNIDEIEVRQNWVKRLYSNPDELTRVGKAISSSMDMNRLTTRVLLKRAVPHDLVAIKQSIGAFFDLVSSNYETYSQLFEQNLTSQTLSQCADLMNVIHEAVNEECLGQFSEGQVILDGYDTVLDEKRAMRNHGDTVFKEYLDRFKEQNGITIAKIGYNRIIGYYIEVPKGQVQKVPTTFYRKQTLVNGERFTSDELIKYEKEMLSASATAEEREKELYTDLLDRVLALSPSLNAIGHFMNTIDVYQSLAVLAIDSSFVCPVMTKADVLEIKAGRHPVVERQLGPGKFVSNDLDMSTRFCLITGPNMAGKSTFLRQNALIILLAHIGSFVPATHARIGLVDRIFCRVGAMDNLARGESTFLLEMQEAAFILRSCTERSFVIVDEIGRGTSTQDGMSIAYAVMKDLMKKGPKTLFATHYHELTMIDTSGIRLLTLEVDGRSGDVVFLRKVKDGVANSSYGIHVAKMAGVPANVIKDARNFQNRHFADYSMNQNSLFTSNEHVDDDVSSSGQWAVGIAREMEEVDLDRCTPMQAMIILSGLKEKAMEADPTK